MSQHRRVLWYYASTFFLTLEEPEIKIVEFANSVDPDEVAHIEPPHLGLHCLPYSHSSLNMISLFQTYILLYSSLMRLYNVCQQLCEASQNDK